METKKSSAAGPQAVIADGTADGGSRRAPRGAFTAALPSVPPSAFASAPPMIGESPALGQIREIASSIASRRCTVLVLGETGTGKEMLARSIHAQSDRRHAPFIPVDCSALTDSLFESQLFGHVKGAFTGAMRDSLGFIRAADTGTLFLDEIGELSLPLQSKLLRVIQERSVVPVGDTRGRSVDVRIVCATHRDLRKMVSDATFREDLYFRLNVVTLNCRRFESGHRMSSRWPIIFLRTRRKCTTSHSARSPSTHKCDAALPLAGQCPRTGQRHRACPCAGAG